ncbi:MAG: ABC transporter permease [Lachnospiraceae bacterium]|nr:ABC transporter permease [Lachnospiraceae bacterium]
MLKRKLFREIKSNWGQFFSVFLLAFLAMALYCCMEGNVLSQHTARTDFHESCNLADLWIYGERFSEEDLEAVKALEIVEDAGLRMMVTGSAPECDGAQVDIYLERENAVNRPYYIAGEEFDPADSNGVWLTAAFAEAREIQVGDAFTVSYNGITFTREVKGLIESPEYEFRQAEGDADIYLENIAFVYMSYNAFPIREYVEHLISQGKITARSVAEETDLLEEQLELLEQNGRSIEDITQDMLQERVKQISDEKLAEIMPYTQLLVTTADGKALEHEDELAEALHGEYAAMVDEHSIAGIERLNSELAQHQSFSWLFVILFVGIAVLVIATSMSRMVEKQRTQIGTLNALGMKRYKIIFHYIGFSFSVAFAGTVLGLWIGSAFLAPVMVEIFARWYIVPGLRGGFHANYLLTAALIVLVCTLAAYLSCRRILRVRPAEALHPAPPKQGRSCMFEKLPFWGRLGFNSQYNLRDISRAKLRAAMGVIGTAVGMLLMIYGIACNSLVDQMEEVTFGKVQTADYVMSLSADAKLTEVDEIAAETGSELVMTAQIEIAGVPDAAAGEKKKEMLTVLEGKGLYNLLDQELNRITLKTGEVGVSRKLCEDMGLSVGDTFYWHIYSENQWHEARVGYIFRSMETQGIAFLREDYEKTGAEYVPTAAYSNQNLEHYRDSACVTAVHGKKEMKQAFETSMEVVSIMVWMMVVFSAVLIVVVLYNSGNLSFHERVGEFATLKVLGMQSARIRNILTVQNLWLSVIGIVIGAPFGRISLNMMMNSNGENFDYALTVSPGCYLISGVLVLTVSMAVSFLFSGRIRDLDMVEILKGTE